MANKTINVNQLQAQISQVLKDAQRGTIFEVMRYSKPMAVVLSFQEYQKLQGECQRCIKDLRKLVK
ncbi:MAG: type II toxin-antitoxin system prevent-host-death family antitoxin [Patescibacteria group bacterium]